jgi:hypothetical protein
MSTWADFLQNLADSRVGTSIHESGIAFAWIESLHVLMVVIVVGSIAIVDLRLLGYRSHRRGARQLMTDLLPFTWGAFTLAVVTGGSLFTSQAPSYWESVPFRLKMAVLLLAGVNMAIFHMTAYRKIVEWDDASLPPLVVRIAGATSLCLWIVIIFLGRWIGFSVPFA